jgi:hypothetical protein
MMPMMSIMMMFIFYKMPSGLNLYIMFSSLFGWLEQARIRRHIREQEEAGTLHAPPTIKKSKDDFLDRPPRAKLSWWQRLQKASEDAQKAHRTQRALHGREIDLFARLIVDEAVRSAAHPLAPKNSSWISFTSQAVRPRRRGAGRPTGALAGWKTTGFRGPCP